MTFFRIFAAILACLGHYGVDDGSFRVVCSAAGKRSDLFTKTIFPQMEKMQLHSPSFPLKQSQVKSISM